MASETQSPKDERKVIEDFKKGDVVYPMRPWILNNDYLQMLDFPPEMYLVLNVRCKIASNFVGHGYYDPSDKSLPRLDDTNLYVLDFDNASLGLTGSNFIWFGDVLLGEDELIRCYNEAKAEDARRSFVTDNAVKDALTDLKFILSQS